MLTIHPVTSASDAKNYYAASDYYTAGESQETVGHWFGGLADRLGLAGRVEKSAFDQLCDNLNPRTGKPLTPRTNDMRRVGYDLTFSGPKSFSVVHALAPDEERQSLDRAFDEAVMETIARDIEPDMLTRRRKGKADDDVTTGNVLGAWFDHTTARPEGGKPPDPHKHRHVLLFNATFDSAEHRIKAGQFGDIVRDKAYYQAAFFARLAGKLEGLGYAIDRRSGTEWEIAGVPQTVIDNFSKRTGRIEAEAEKKGITDAGQKSELGAKTRGKKQQGLTPAELRRAWDDQLSPAERDALAAVHRKEIAPSREVTAAEAVAYALHHCFERESVLPERVLKRVALLHGLGHVTPEEIAAELPRQGVLVGDLDGRRMATTKQVHAEERFITGFVASGRGTVQPVGIPAGLERGKLDDEQWAAVTGLLTSHDRVTLIDSAAGVGKTTALAVYDQAMQRAGRSVTYLGTTSKAVGVLREDGFHAETLAKFLLSDDMQDAARGGHLVVDESSMLGHKDAYRLFRIAKAKDITLTFLGDSRQHASVSAGAFLRLIREYGGITPHRINTIKRQVKAEHREAVGLMYEGKTLAGFDKLDDLGWVHAIADDAARYRAVAEEYVRARQGGESWDQILLLSPTHAEGRLVVDAVRAKLREAGLIGQEEREFTRWVSSDLTEAERGDARNYRPGLVDMLRLHQHAEGGYKSGDRVMLDGEPPESLLVQAARFQAYRKETIKLSVGDVLRFDAGGRTLDGHQIRNGSAYQVAGFTASGIRLANGWLIGKDYGHFRHYIETSPGSQGVGVNRTIIIQSSLSAGAGSMEQAYVSASRAKKQVSWYTDDKASLRSVIQRSSLKLAASDLVKPPAAPEPARKVWRKRLAQWVRSAALARMRAVGQAPTQPAPERQQERQVSYGYGR